MRQPAFVVRALGLLLAGCALDTSAAAAAEPAPDKSRYSLLDPTPRQYLREMSTDRPDKTESAYTVDAGHFQIEMDLVTYGRDRHTTDDTRVESVAIAPMNLKIGLTNRADLQIVIESYTHVRTTDRTTDAVVHDHGFGDVTVRLKMNLWGNDQGKSALAAMPFVKVPTNQDDLGNDAVEGGLIFPLAIALPSDWGMGLMTELDFNEDDDGDGYHPEFVNTVTLGHDIIGDLAGYVEFFSLVSSERDSEWQGTVDFGLTYALTEDIQLDGGINFGFTHAAEDFNPFLGLSVRL